MDTKEYKVPCYFCKDICYLKYEPKKHHRCLECSQPSSKYYLQEVPKMNNEQIPGDSLADQTCDKRHAFDPSPFCSNCGVKLRWKKPPEELDGYEIREKLQSLQAENKCFKGALEKISDFKSAHHAMAVKIAKEALNPNPPEKPN